MGFKRWPDPAVGLLVTVALFGVLEAASYAFGTFPGRPDPLITATVANEPKVRAYDHLLFWKHKSSTGGKVTINRLGLRGQEIPTEASTEFRVLSLGESTTFGGMFTEAETYSARVERSIDAVHGKRLRVINAGVPGYTVVQGYAYLRYRSPAVKPDAVLLYFGYNDSLPIFYRAKRDRGLADATAALDDWTLLERRRQPLSRLAAWLFDRSNLVRGLTRLVTAQSAADPEDAAPIEHLVETREPRVPEAIRRKTLERVLSLCRQRGLHLTVVVPWYRSYSAHEPLLRRFAAAHGITLVDLPTELQWIEDRNPYFVDIVHPNPEGHRLIAERIVALAAPAWQRHVAEREASSR